MRDIKVDPEEYRVVMTFRHRKELEEYERRVMMAIVDIGQNKDGDRINPSQIVELMNASGSLVALQTSCGIICHDTLCDEEGEKVKEQ